MKFALQLKADLEYLTDLQPDGKDFRWYVKLKCLNCGEITPEFVYVTEEERFELKGSRGDANLVLKCKFCNRQNSIDILPDTISSYTIDDSGKYKSIVHFDCRGLEPTEFDPRLGWCAKGAETSTTFAEIDLKDRDWSDFDEKAKESVGIYNLEASFVVVK